MINHNIFSVFVVGGVVHHVEINLTKDVALRSMHAQSANIQFDNAVIYDVAVDSQKNNTQIMKLYEQ
jgi:hypothetical protein